MTNSTEQRKHSYNIAQKVWDDDRKRGWKFIITFHTPFNILQTAMTKSDIPHILQP